MRALREKASGVEHEGVQSRELSYELGRVRTRKVRASPHVNRLERLGTMLFQHGPAASRYIEVAMETQKP